MSRNILAFALVMSFWVGAANGQDAKKPGEEPPAKQSAGKAESLRPPKPVIRRDPNVRPKLRPATPDEKRMLEKGRAGRAAVVVGPELRAKAIERTREIIRLANSPATDVAQTINEMLRSERATGPGSAYTVVIVPDAISNSLVISGTPQAIGEVVELVKELDADTPMVAIRVLMVEIVSEGKTAITLDDLSAFVEDGTDASKKGAKPILLASREAGLVMVKELAGKKGVEILARVQVTTLDNQSAYVQIGSRVPLGGAAGGSKTGKVQFENIGLILGVTPRIGPEGVVTMEVDFEKSELGNAAGGESVPPVETIRVQTTVSVADGRTLVLGGIVAEAGNEKRELLMVVTPQIVAAK